MDLVNEKDKVIGRKKRADIYAEGLSNFRVMNAFLRNSKGELWIPRRTADKAVFPSCLDISAAGHVESGETYEDTFRREVMEELNVDVDAVPHRLLGKVTPTDGLSAFEWVYEIQSDEAPNYNPRDFTEFFWLTPRGLFERITAGEKVKSDLPKLVEMFYADRL